ncbi:hypothetical protein CI1B_26080 [Bradyrhizobium ivorense]|uniref:Uncharacterized protein n=1 Tax=Bradyrhizobium ivorense TaxID=2511166 RepID=A0A508T4E7_9BRAD|nr:hypothetical protein CI1B_26080 [Bradyrhizobium ivorense]
MVFGTDTALALVKLELKAVFGSIFLRFPALRLAVAAEELKLRKEIILAGSRSSRCSGDVVDAAGDRDLLRNLPARMACRSDQPANR